MIVSFGPLLRKFRQEAKLTQQELAQMIHVTGSMISRLETELSPPSLSIVQAIITALATKDLPRIELDQMREVAGFSQSISDAPVADPIIPLINQEFEKLRPEYRKLLSADLLGRIEIAQSYFSAEIAMEQRKLRLAEKILSSLVDLLERRTAPWYLRIDESKGRCLYGTGDYAVAVLHYDSALWRARQLDDLSKEAEILIQQGDAQRRRGGAYWNVAHQCYSEAEKIFQNLNNHVRVAHCLRKIAGVYLFQGLPNDALALCEKSLTICREEGDDRGIYKALQHMTWAFDMLGRWREATELCEEAFSIVRRVTSDVWELVAALRYLGDAYRIERQVKFTGNGYHITRRIEEAEKTYKEVLNILHEHGKEEIREKLDSNLARLGLGKIYLKQPGREHEAKLFLNEGLRDYLELGEDFRVFDFLSEQGSLLLKLGSLEEAEMRLQTASNHFKDLENIFHYAHTLASLCELYYEKPDLKRVYSTAEVARNIDNGLINYHLARIEFIVGKSQVSEERYVEAVESFCTASHKALDFNYESFGEVCNDILDEIERIAREMTPEVAVQICDSYINYWDKQEKVSTKQRSIQEGTEAVLRKKEKIKAFMPIK